MSRAPGLGHTEMMRRLSAWARYSRRRGDSPRNSRYLIWLLGMIAGLCWQVTAAEPDQRALERLTDPVERLHLLIPGSAGGGWDSTARGVGRALKSSGLLEQVSFENMSGAGGAKGVAHMQETAAQNQHVLMVSSTPIVARSLLPVFRQSWRDLTPVAAVVGDYGIVAVRADSPIRSLDDLLQRLRDKPRAIKFAGGSNRGGLDHLIAARLFQVAGLPLRDIRYVAYDAGGKALLALLSGETPVMSATAGDAMTMVRAGKVRVLAIAAPERLPELPDVPTFSELDLPMVFVNWRGFFGVPGLQEERIKAYGALLQHMSRTPEWEQIRARHGWVNNFIVGDDFRVYLERQEQVTGELMRTLGFIQ